MADDTPGSADPKTVVAAESISRTIVSQREKLNADLAAYDRTNRELVQRRAALDAEWQAMQQEWQAHREALAQHEKNVEALALHELALTQERRELDAHALRLSAREEKALKHENENHRKATELSDRQGEVEKGEREHAQRLEAHRIGMHRLKEIVEEYFRAPGK